MRKILVALLFASFVYGGELREIKSKIESVNKSLSELTLQQKKIGNSLVELKIKLYRDKSGVVRKMSIEAEWEDAVFESGEYIYSKDGSLLYSLVSSFNADFKRECYVKIKSYFRDKKPLKKYKLLNSGCDKYEDYQVLQKSLPYLPPKIDNPLKFFKNPAKELDI